VGVALRDHAYEIAHIPFLDLMDALGAPIGNNIHQLRVVSPDVGGGFGLKGGPFPDDALVVWASKKLRRPVKWVATRSEAMMTDHTSGARYL